MEGFEESFALVSARTNTICGIGSETAFLFTMSNEEVSGEDKYTLLQRMALCHPFDDIDKGLGCV